MKPRRPCAGLWNTPMVHLNGDLTTCCLDTGLKNRLGNLRTDSLDALWYGPRIHAWRLAQIRGDYASSGPYCTECDWWSAGTYPDDLIEDYLEQTGEKELLRRFRKRRKTRSLP